MRGRGVGGGRGGRTAITDDQGRYRLSELSADTYTVTASKGGFVDAIYGQRRPQQPGTPVQVADGQEAANVDLRLVRGGVITGHVLDEDGEALSRALVTVQRYQYVRGERQLTPAGGDQTDDRGQYRVFGLPAGDYYVSATAGGLGQLIGRGLQQLATGAGALGGGRGGRGPGGPGAFGAFGATPDSEPTGYAPTYYPGVVSGPEAGKVNVAPGQEVVGIDFQIQRPLRNRQRHRRGGRRRRPRAVDAAGLRWPRSVWRPGAQRTLAGRRDFHDLRTSSRPLRGDRAIGRTRGRSENRHAISRGERQNIAGETLVLQGGVTVAGNITVESAGTPAPSDYSSFRVDVPDVSPLPFGGGGGGRGGGPAGRSEKNGAFEVTNLLPGKHFIRVTGAGQGQAQWTLKSVNIGGQDVTDQAVELKAGQNVDNVTVVLTDRTTEISGTVRDGKSTGMPALTVIAFSTDQQYWRAQSRHIQAVRTDQAGAYACATSAGRLPDRRRRGCRAGRVVRSRLPGAGPHRRDARVAQ